MRSQGRCLLITVRSRAGTGMRMESTGLCGPSTWSPTGGPHSPVTSRNILLIIRKNPRRKKTFGRFPVHS